MRVSGRAFIVFIAFRRLAKDESLWACLAALASYHKNLDTAEIAYASLGLADKVIIDSLIH